MREGAGDPELYKFARYRGRQKVIWPEGKACTVWIAPNLECYEIDPLNHELADRQIVTVQQQSADTYVESILDAYDWLLTKSDKWGGRMLLMHITPYIMGLPYRIGAFEKLLQILAAKQGAWFANGGEIADSWIEQNPE